MILRMPSQLVQHIIRWAVTARMVRRRIHLRTITIGISHDALSTLYVVMKLPRVHIARSIGKCAFHAVK